VSLVIDRDVIFDSERVEAARTAAEFVVPPDSVLQEYCEQIAYATKSEMSFVTFVFESSHHVVAKVGFPDEGDLVVAGERPGTFERTACAFLVAIGEPVTFPDTLNFDFLNECIPTRTGVRSYTAAPLRFRGKVIGSFGVCDTRPRALTSGQFKRLISMADDISSELKARTET